MQIADWIPKFRTRNSGVDKYGNTPLAYEINSVRESPKIPSKRDSGDAMNQILYKSYQDLGESQGLCVVATAHILTPIRGGARLGSPPA